VRPFSNPNFSGPVILGKPNQWFNPNAIIAPPATSGFYGNVGRDTYSGPGLATGDFSVLKDSNIRERLNLQFRAEIFNLLNRANFKYAKTHRVYAANHQQSEWAVRHGGRHYQQHHQFAPGATRAEAALVAPEPPLARGSL
jgi:hypothetical protein